MTSQPISASPQRRTRQRAAVQEVLAELHEFRTAQQIHDEGSFAEWLQNDPKSPLVAYRREGDDDATLFDVDVTYQQQYTDMDVTQVPRAFRPQIGPLELNYWERVYATLPDEDIYEERQISRDGAVVVVRPDHYVAAVLPLDATDELSSFFEGVLTAK